jgi:hypothetical protein
VNSVSLRFTEDADAASKGSNEKAKA